MSPQSTAWARLYSHLCLQHHPEMAATTETVYHQDIHHLWYQTAPGIMRVVHAHHLFADVGQAKAKEVDHLHDGETGVDYSAGGPGFTTQHLKVQHLVVHLSIHHSTSNHLGQLLNTVYNAQSWHNSKYQLSTILATESFHAANQPKTLSCYRAVQDPFCATDQIMTISCCQTVQSPD